MGLLANHPRLSRLVAGLALSAGLTGLLAPAAWAATANSMPEMGGWIRLAHLSPNTPAVDVYLYSFSNPHAKVVLHHVGYGTVSSYMKVPAGEYTVAMRTPGASPASPPVLSTAVHVVSDDAYTVAGIGPADGLRLKVLRDRLETPAGKILIRVIQASLHQHLVTVTAGKEILADKLPFGQLTTYRVANPGTWIFRASGGSWHISRSIKLVPDCIHTIVILDGSSDLKIHDLLDSAGMMEMPSGGVETGLGGTAPRPAFPAAPWLAMAGAGGLLAAAGGIAIRRRHAR
jgi:hypothetical protein